VPALVAPVVVLDIVVELTVVPVELGMVVPVVAGVDVDDVDEAVAPVSSPFPLQAISAETRRS